MHELVSPYSLSLIAVSVLVLMVMLQNITSASIRHSASQGTHVPGSLVEPDHADTSYRLARSFGNSLENFGAFIVTIALAIIFAVDPFWVNLSASVYVVARVGHWAAYAANRPPLRSLCFAVGFFSNFALAVAVLLIVLF